MIDLGAELVAALRSPDGRAALADAVRTVVAVEVRAALNQSEEAHYLDSSALAKMLGISPAALRMRLRRGSAFSGIALTVDGKRVWRRGDIEALIARNRLER